MGELKRAQSRDFQHARPPGPPVGARDPRARPPGGDRRDEHPNSRRNNDFIPTRAYRAMRSAETDCDAALNNERRSQSTLEAALRSIKINLEKGRQRDNAMSFLSDHNIGDYDNDDSAHHHIPHQVEPPVTESTDIDTRTEETSTVDDASLLRTGPERQAYATLVSQFKGIETWDPESQSLAVEGLLDDPVHALGLGMTGDVGLDPG